MYFQLPDFSQARLLVVGDVMLDQYWRGPSERVSPEAPVPIVKVEDRSDYPGGAGNVALNAAALGCQVKLIGCIGDDDAGKRLTTQLHAANIECHFHHFDQLPTITKLRILSQNQQLLRLDFEQASSKPASITLWETSYQTLLQQVDMLILSDYGKGLLNEAPRLIEWAQAAQVPVCVDPKRADFQHYRAASIITPNMKEFQQAVGPCSTEDEIECKARALLEQCDIDALLITRSEKGMCLIQQNQSVIDIPTYAREVFDVTGAVTRSLPY